MENPEEMANENRRQAVEIEAFEKRMRQVFPDAIDEATVLDLERSLQFQLSMGDRATQGQKMPARIFGRRRGPSSGLAQSAAAIFFVTTAVGWSLWFASPVDTLNTGSGTDRSEHVGLDAVWVSKVRDGGEIRGEPFSAGDIVKLHFSVDRDALGIALAIDSHLDVHELSTGFREIGTPTQMFAFELEEFDDGPLAVLLLTTTRFRSSASIFREIRELIQKRLSNERTLEENVATLIETLESGGEREVRATILEFRKSP